MPPRSRHGHSEESFDTSWQLLFDPPAAEIRSSRQVSSSSKVRHEDVWPLRNGEKVLSGDDDESLSATSATTTGAPSFLEGYSSGSEAEARRPRASAEARRPRASAEAVSDGAIQVPAPAQFHHRFVQARGTSSRPPQPPISPEEATAAPSAPLPPSLRLSFHPEPAASTWRRKPLPPALSPQEAEEVQPAILFASTREVIDELSLWAGTDDNRDKVKEVADCRWVFAEMAKEAAGIAPVSAPGGSAGSSSAAETSSGRQGGQKIDLNALFAKPDASSGDHPSAEVNDLGSYRSPFCQWTSSFAPPRQASAVGAMSSHQQQPGLRGQSIF
eukprot:TRINITY_DN2026_c0_g1_i1.p1 TRINITY_DN2026_c0_g1~~TRINITY_DN2026_c0_g1_i1.p1  ORF type:complete len:356 (-),score=40.08 TRINITY_DN2026_c0_g1_i1:102-1091(-)